MNLFKATFTPLLLFIALSANSQRFFEFQWAQKTLYDSGRIAAYDKFAIDSSQNIYVTGLFDGQLNFMDSTYFVGSKQRAYLAKLDSSGHLLWIKRINLGRTIASINIAVKPDQDIVLAGTHNDSSYIYQNGYWVKPEKLFVAQFDSTGKIEWFKSAKGKLSSCGGLAIDPNGIIYLSGGYDDTMIVDKDTLLPSGPNQWFNDNLFLLAMEDSGKVLFSRIDSGSNAYITGVTTCNKHVYLSGFYYGYLKFSKDSIISNGSRDGFIAQFSNDGTFKWAKTGGGESSDHFDKPVVTQDGSIFAPGYMQGNHHAVYKFDTSGKVISKFLPVSGVFGSVHLALNKNDALFGMDYTQDYINYGDTIIHMKGSGPILVSFTHDLKVKWADVVIEMGGSFFDLFHIRKNYYYLTGNFYGTVNIPGFNLTQQQNTGYSCFIAKIKLRKKPLAGLKESSQSEIRIFPNPVKTKISIQFSEGNSSHRKISIYDALGKIIYSTHSQKGTPKEEINIAYFISGIYLVKVETASGSTVKKFIKY